MDKIDFVIIWVDGNDLAWRQEKSKYAPTANGDDRDVRYRDWDNLKYWFRAVEKFAPWVNKVYFVTWGHLPAWLNTNCQKLVVVNHKDYIPEEYLPTFSSHPIELNLHRIKDLSDNFVYFNDDMFLLQSVQPEDFYKNGKPVHAPMIHAILPLGAEDFISHIYVNMISAINRHFNVKKVLKQNCNKWLNPINVGLKSCIMSLFNGLHAEFVGFYNEHLPVPMNKNTMNQVWEEEYELLHQTCLHKFRDKQDVSQYIFRYWDMASGNFETIKPNKHGKRYTLTINCDSVVDDIVHPKYKMICLNDMNETCGYDEFIKVRDTIKDAFKKRLPEKSIFEL